MFNSLLYFYQQIFFEKAYTLLMVTLAFHSNLSNMSFEQFDHLDNHVAFGMHRVF